MSREFLPFHRASIDDAEIQEVVETLRSGWLTTGPRVKLFEEGFSAYVNAPYAVALNSCTAALHLALNAIGQLAENPEQRQRFGHASRRIAVERFDVQSIAEQISEL